MELLRPCLFFYLLAILLSLSISSTTNSDPTNTETLQWKGGEGAKRSRVRRQNLNLQHALRLPEKAYAFYMLWKLLNEMYNDTNTIKPLTMRPDKLEFTTSEGPKNMEIEVKPSSAPIQEQSTHSIGMTGTNDSTAMASFPTEPSSLDSQKTTQLEDLQLVEQSTQRLQTTREKITEPDQAIEQHIPDSTTSKIPSKAAEPSIALHEQIDHVTSINGTNNSTTMAFFPIDSLPDSQETTQSGDLKTAEQSAQHFQTTKHKIIEPSEVTEQHILDSTTFTNKISKAPEEPSSITIHEQIDHFTGINGTNNSTAMVSLPTQSSLPDSQKTTQSGDSQLAEKSTQRLQTTKQKITEPSEVTEQDIIDSTTFTIKTSSKAAEEPSSITIHEQIDHFTGINGTNNSTAMVSFPTQSSLPDSQKTTQSGDLQTAEQSAQHFQTTKHKIIEPSEITEQHILDSTTFTNKISSKAPEEPSSITIHEQIDHFTGINGTNNSTAMVSLPTQSSLPDSQKTTQSGDSQLAEKSTQRLQTTKQKITEPSEVTEQDILDSTTFTIKTSSKAAEEPSSITIHEQIDHFTGINRTNNSTAVASFPTHSLPDSLETTQSGDSQLAEKSTQLLQTTIQKITEPNKVTEQHILDSTTFTIKISSKAAEEPSSTALHEQINQFTAINGTNNSTAMVSLPTQSSLPDLQQTSQSGDSQLLEQSVQRIQTTKQKMTGPSEVTEQHIPDSTIFSTKISSKAAEPSIALHEQIDHVTSINGTNNSTTMASFPIDSLPDSQETTQSGDLQTAEQSAQHFQTTKHKIIEPSEVTEQHILDSTTFTNKISSKAPEEPSSITIHEQINHFTGINGTNNSTAVPSFPIQSSLPDSQKTTQTGDSKMVEESPQHENPEPIIRSTGTNGTNDSTPIMSSPTDLPSQESQKNTQSGAPQLLEHSTQHFQILKQKMTAPSQKIVQPTAIMSTPDQATTYRMQQTTPPQSAIDPHIPNNDILASTMENENLQPTSLPQMTKNEQPKMTPVINGMVQSISKPTHPARTKQTTLSTVKSEIKKNSPHTLSVTWQNGKPNWLVTSTDWRVSKPTPPTFTLKQQIQESTSLLLTEDSPNSDLSESTSDPEHHKPKRTEEPTNQHTEKDTTNTAKSSRDSVMQPFTTTNTHRLTNETLGSSKTASTSPLPNLTESHLVDSKGPEDTSLPTGISLQDYTSFRIYQSNAKTQSQRTTNKYTILSKMTSHTSFPLVKDTSTQAPTDRVRSSQTIPVSTEKLIMMLIPNPKPLEKHIHTTSVMRHGFLTSRTQENPSWISTKRSNIQPTETAESRSDSINQGPTADSMPKGNYTNNDLLTKMDKPTQSMSGRKPSTTTHIATTRTVSQKPKTFILPTHKSANTAIEDDMKTRRDIFGLFFTFGCLMLLIIVILLRVIWRKWQARHFGSNMWVAGPPLLWGTYHSVLQNSSSHTAIQMRKENSKKTKQENSDVFETIALKQQHKDLV